MVVPGGLAAAVVVVVALEQVDDMDGLHSGWVSFAGCFFVGVCIVAAAVVAVVKLIVSVVVAAAVVDAVCAAVVSKC